MTITSVHDGSSDKFYRAWADSADGSKGFSTTDSTKEYFGVYAGTTPPANYKAYSWTKIKGEAGRSVTNTEMEYAINDSKVTPPKSGWSLEMPVWKTGLYIWQRVKVTYSTGNPSYTTPHCLESNIIEDVTGNIGDWIFRDKTEVLSGTEIFTDKADEEALVHVGVDGKSYQNAGSGKNLINQNMTHLPTIEIIEGIKYYKINGITNDAKITFESFFKTNTQYTIQFLGLVTNYFNMVVVEYVDGESQRKRFTHATLDSLTTISGKTVSRMIIDTGSLGSFGYIKVDTFQLEEGPVATEYEPPAPSPDYPIEIHSLNNVDVVSSVGLRNHAQNNNNTSLTLDIPSSGYTYRDYNIDLSPRYPKVGDKFYLSADIENGSGITGNGLYLRDFTNGYNGGNNNHSPKDKIGNINTITQSNVDKLIIVFRSQGSSGSTTTAKNIYAINLTEHFGEGNEPSLEWCQNNLRYTPNLQDIQETDNHTLIDKTNLLLDEPLRSVGDVKDRLFRDNDGLWKVERKTAERIISGGMLSYRYGLGAQGINTFYNTNFPNAKMGYQTSISSHFKNVTGGWDAHEHGIGYSDHTNAVNKYFYFSDSLTGIGESDSAGIATQKINNWLALNPVGVVYQLANPVMETLPQSLQDKLNNLRTFKDSNYIYTVLPDKSNILSENLKPTLHATFKSIAWANDFKYKFEQAKAMHSTDIWFAKGVSNTIAPNIGWSTDAPVWEDGLYIWSKTITTYGNGRTEETSPVCITGATGRSVDKIEEWYYLSNKPDVLEGGTWSKTPPTWKDGKYIWTKNKIIYKNPSGSEETSPINTTGGSGQKGDSGTDAKTVRLGNIIHAVHFDQDGLMPSVSSIAFPTAIQGFSGLTPYYEFKMGDTIVRGLSTASSWTLNTSAMKYSDFPLTVTVNVVISGQTLATDTVTIVGTKPGEDAYTVVLANESHTFVGDVSNAIAGSTTANVIAYRGGTQVGATIGAISGLPTGMSSAIYSNGTTAARVTFTVTTSMTSPNGVVNIPVTVNGKSFTKVFNYAIAFKGAKGDKGTDGIAGKDGVGIKSTVLAYASSTSGTTTPTSGWQSTVPTVAAGNYLWTRTTWTYTDNSVENGYTVSRIGKDGNTGKDGIAGKDGVGIKSTAIHYAKSTSGTSHSGVTWLTTVPSVPNGQYLWTRTTWTYDDNTTETGYSVAKMGETGATGPQGVSITKVDVQYYLSTSNTSLTGGSWSTTAPAWVDGRFMWSKTVTTYTSGSPTESKPVCITGAKGSTGGTGATGRGISTIVEQFYLSTSKTTQTGGSWSTTMPTWSPGKYVWTRSLITYTTGTPATSTTEPLVSSEWEAVNELEIGGRNLAVYSTIGEYSGGSNRDSLESKVDIDGSKINVKSHLSDLIAFSIDNISQYDKLNISFFSNLPSPTMYYKFNNTNQSNTKFTKKDNFFTGVLTVPNGAVSLVIGLGEYPQPAIFKPYYIDKVMVEKGNVATDWSPAPEDIQSQINKSVKSTDVEYYLSTSSTGLAGGSWQTIAPIWTDGKYMWSRTKVILNDGTPIYRPSTTGTNITGAKGATGATGATGAKGNPGENATARNFLLESKPSSPITNSSYPTANFLLAEKPVVGETYTITIKGQLAATKTAFYAYNSGGSINLASNIVHQGNGLYYKSFNWINSYSTGTTANDTSVVIYPFTSSQSGTSTIEWITMVKGSVPLKEWVPAHEDIYQYVDDIEIGARNIVNNSNNFELSGSDMGTITRREFNNNVGKITGLSSGNFNAYQWLDGNIADPNFFSKAGEKYIFSVDIKATGTVTAVIGFDFRDSTGAIKSQFFNSGFSVNGQWQRVLIPYTVIGDGKTRMLVNLTGTITSGAVIEYKNFQIEKGNKPTDWSPSPEDVQSLIDLKADGTSTEAALNEAAAKLQVLQQEVEAAATSNELKDFIDKYNKDMTSRDNAARESESGLSSALTSITAIQNNLGDMSETWTFIDRFIKNTPQGVVVGNDSSGSYILIKEDRLSFYSNGQEVAFISQNLMEISRGAFVEQIQIAKYQFEESTTNHLTVRFVG